MQSYSSSVHVLHMKKGESGRLKKRGIELAAIDVALRKLGRAEEQMEFAHHHKESALPKSLDKLSSYSVSVVPSR